MALTYSDMLIPLDSWPSTTRGYYYDGGAGSPALKITLKFDPTPYNPAAVAAHRHLNSSRLADELPVWQRNATTDLAKFERIYFQLNQNYDKLAVPVPGLSGPAVTMTLFNSLLAAPERPLGDTERDAILAYVNAAYTICRSAPKAKRRRHRRTPCLRFPSTSMRLRRRAISSACSLPSTSAVRAIWWRRRCWGRATASRCPATFPWTRAFRHRQKPARSRASPPILSRSRCSRRASKRLSSRRTGRCASAPVPPTPVPPATPAHQPCGP